MAHSAKKVLIGCGRRAGSTNIATLEDLSCSSFAFIVDCVLVVAGKKNTDEAKKQNSKQHFHRAVDGRHNAGVDMQLKHFVQLCSMCRTAENFCCTAVVKTRSLREEGVQTVSFYKAQLVQGSARETRSQREK
eukprot:TRINITY_DN285_c0_g1_i1.p2 TRINITY_DN285_c0_g1~~TRINITY_DN285_c0_g1_i1.p2  ORF type:complete len:133 (-),score=21.06 TRINITY_DN285_c0_g1_i1:658-1056(-)